MDEFAVREVLGVAQIYEDTRGNVASVRLSEGDNRIRLSVWCAGSGPPELTPDQARKLARQFNRLARRIELRNA